MRILQPYLDSAKAKQKFESWLKSMYFIGKRIKEEAVNTFEVKRILLIPIWLFEYTTQSQYIGYRKSTDNSLRSDERMLSFVFNMAVFFIASTACLFFHSFVKKKDLTLTHHVCTIAGNTSFCINYYQSQRLLKEMLLNSQPIANLWNNDQYKLPFINADYQVKLNSMMNNIEYVTINKPYTTASKLVESIVIDESKQVAKAYGFYLFFISFYYF